MLHGHSGSSGQPSGIAEVRSVLPYLKQNDVLLICLPEVESDLVPGCDTEADQPVKLALRRSTRSVLTAAIYFHLVLLLGF